MVGSGDGLLWFWTGAKRETVVRMRDSGRIVAKVARTIRAYACVDVRVSARMPARMRRCARV